MKILEKIGKSKVGLFKTIQYAYYKGVFPSLRGFRYSAFNRRITFPIFIDKGAKIQFPDQFKVGKNFFLGRYSLLNGLSLNGVEIGDNVTIREFSWMQITSHLNEPGIGVRIGKNSYFGPRAIIGASGMIEIGKDCQFGANVQFVAENHIFGSSNTSINSQGVQRKGIKVGNDCWFGNNCVVLDGVEIGTGVVLGANTLVRSDIPDFAVCVGQPHKIVKYRK